jgi:hypothetical protein
MFIKEKKEREHLVDFLLFVKTYADTRPLPKGNHFFGHNIVTIPFSAYKSMT